MLEVTRCRTVGQNRTESGMEIDELQCFFRFRFCFPCGNGDLLLRCRGTGSSLDRPPRFRAQQDPID